jgi:C4-type Zn-finger protein
MPRPINCPFCGSDIRRDKVDTEKSFPCPSCGRLLRVSPYYYPIPGVGAVLVCGLLGYAFGFRNLKLLLFVVVLWFPVTAFLFAVLNLTFNPKVEEGYPDSSDLNLRG